MNCEKYSEWISLYIDGMLEEKECISFENHIRNCDSCREEVEIIQEMTDDIQALEMIELPEGFHKELMERIKLESNQKQEKIIPLAIKKNKWYLNLKIASAVAAVFIFSTVLFNPSKTNVPKESLVEIEDNIEKSRMIDLPDEAVVQGAIFSMEEIALDLKSETWIINTPMYKEYKETVMSISSDMGLEVFIVEELESTELKTQNITLEITLEHNQKAKFKDLVTNIDDTVNIAIEEAETLQELEDLSKVTVVIIINQIS